MLIIVLLVAGFIFYKPLKEKFFPANQTIFTYDIIINAEADYLIKEGVTTLQQGKTQTGVLEKFTAHKNTTYTFVAWSDKYYQDQTPCLESKCQLELKKMADLIARTTYIDEGIYRLALRITNGTLQKPLICLKWDYSLVDVSLTGYNQTQTPDELNAFYDRCYQIEQDYQDQYLDFEITYKKDSSLLNPPEQSVFEILIRDTCEQEGGCLADVKRSVKI